MATRTIPRFETRSNGAIDYGTIEGGRPNCLACNINLAFLKFLCRGCYNAEYRKAKQGKHVDIHPKPNRAE